MMIMFVLPDAILKLYHHMPRNIADKCLYTAKRNTLIVWLVLININFVKIELHYSNVSLRY